MSKSYKTVTGDINASLVKMHKEMPEVMKAFGAMAKAATTDGALDKKTKECIALALGISGHCEGCIGFHVKALVAMGLTREELMDLLGMTIYMGGGPSLMYAAEALSAFEEFSE